MDAMTVEAREPSYFERIWQLRYFWFSLVKIDLRARYRRSMLGIGWSLVRPLAMCTVLCIVFSKIFNTDVVEYGPYLLLGLAVWQFLIEAAIGGCTCFMVAANYIRQQPLPLAIFPLRTVLGAGFHGLIAMGVAVLLILVLRGPANLITLPTLAISVVLIFLLGWLMAILAGLLHAHFPDTQHLLEIGFQILFYLTPVMYPASVLEGRGRIAWVISMNPVTYFLDMVRRPLLTGELPPLQVYLVAAGTVGVLALLAYLMLRRLERTLVFWL
jgi:homopolymeric O-antigen transport system permease protein